MKYAVLKWGTILLLIAFVASILSAITIGILSAFKIL
jgi:hypothetical protein